MRNRELDSWAACEGCHKDLGSFIWGGWVAKSQFSSRNPASTLGGQQVSKEQMLRSHTKKGLNICPVSCTSHCRRQAVQLGPSLVGHWSLFVGSVTGIKLWYPNIASSVWEKKNRIQANTIISWLVWGTLCSPEPKWCALMLLGKAVHTTVLSCRPVLSTHHRLYFSLRSNSSQERQKSCCKSICTWKLI